MLEYPQPLDTHDGKKSQSWKYSTERPHGDADSRPKLPPLGDSLMDLLDILLLGIFVFIMRITLIERFSIENVLPSFSFSSP